MLIQSARTLTLAGALAATPALAHEPQPGHAHHETTPPVATPPAAAPAPAEESHEPLAIPPLAPEPHDHMAMDHGTMDHGAMNHGAMNHGAMDHAMMGHEGHDHVHDMADLQGVQGAYPLTRDASGTSWQPDTSTHGGVMAMKDGSMLMGHAMFNGVYDWQDGPRGDEKTFVSGMVMGSARFDRANGDTLNLRAMLSPDPFMGKRGYPLLLAAGETADGVNELVDRQHPHELFMELSGSYSHRLNARNSVFVYAGLPGEPAFGPPAFMHRLSAMDSPEAPITHHWLDSTHITFGVLTAGYVHENVKLEVSSFRGREPDENRFDIETPDLDSTAVRASWNPTPKLALQASWADVKSPEQLHPDEDETRYSASAIYTAPLGDGAWWSTTAALGRKDRSDGVTLDAQMIETAVRFTAPWTVFARAERTETDELGLPGAAPETVSKASLGAIRDFRIHRNAVIGLGALYSKNWVPGALDGAYGGDPDGAMAFVRLKIG